MRAIEIDGYPAEPAYPSTPLSRSQLEKAERVRREWRHLPMAAREAVNERPRLAALLAVVLRAAS